MPPTLAKGLGPDDILEDMIDDEPADIPDEPLEDIPDIPRDVLLVCCEPLNADP